VVKAIKKRDKADLSTIKRFTFHFIHSYPNQLTAIAHRFLFILFCYQIICLTDLSTMRAVPHKYRLFIF